MQKIIEANQLTKRFGALLAVDKINFYVGEGECLGFLGPNGAGKTTTLKMIYGFSTPTEGSLEILGWKLPDHLREIKRNLGVAPQEDSLDPELTVMQNLLVYAHYFDIPRQIARNRAEELLDFFHLGDKKGEEIYQLSGGMKRRLMIARALMNNPKLLLLDEPTTGLDPQARRLMWDRIRGLGQKGVTTLLTTHYMEEAAELCNRVLIMDNGRIIEEGKPSELVRKHGVNNLEEVFLKLAGRELRE
ncbi:MAG: ABC transporter ATP-binding protein [Deltaproteobacteria bacterium]|nr:ABC transporter ATP-binding protein [Deltaproteobacteria bacterium]MBI2500474.1 ABC transporter ATP-binding protein [Deltaproteobacteria bacterium]